MELSIHKFPLFAHIYTRDILVHDIPGKLFHLPRLPLGVNASTGKQGESAVHYNNTYIICRLVPKSPLGR